MRVDGLMRRWAPGAGRESKSSRATIVDAIRGAGTVSRVELSGSTGLGAPSVTAIVRRLIDDGLVEEAGRGAPTGGKPRTLLRVRSSARYVVGVHVSHDDLVFVLLDYAGAVVARGRRPAGHDGDPAGVVGQLVAGVGALLDRGDVARSLVVGLGVASPGPFARDTARSSAPPTMARWIHFPLHRRLSGELGLPVLVENDATAATVGTRIPAAEDASVAAVLFVSEGVGSGLRVGRSVYSGAHGNAGEVGHIAVVPDGPRCWCGGLGCLEAVAGPAAVVAGARAAGLDLGPSATLPAFSELTRLALAGDDRAAGLIRASAAWMAIGAQAVAHMFDSQVLVLTGPALAVAGTFYAPVVQDRIRASSFGSSGLEVVLDEQGADAAAIGAATMMLSSEVAVDRPRASGATAAR